MSIIELKHSLGYIWYRIGCFLIEIYCHISNIGIIRYFDSSIEDKSKENLIIICLILIAFTIVCSSISTVLNFLNGFGNSIEDYPFYLLKYNKKRLRTIPLLSLFDIHIAIIILLPKILIYSQLIKSNNKDQNLLFETSIDFIIGNGMKRFKKDGQPILINDSNTKVSCQIINLFLFLIRFHFSYSNLFYKLNKTLTIIMIINSINSILLILLIYSIFEILFKIQIIIYYSINIYSYLLILSLILSILFILLTNHALFYHGLIIFYKQIYKISNQLIRLSNFDERYVIKRGINRSLIFYLLFIILSLTCQFPLIILILKLILSGLIDYLFIIYLIFISLNLIITIIIFCFLCLFPLSSWNLNYFNKIKENKNLVSFQASNKSNQNFEDKIYTIESPCLNRTRSLSSSGLTVIDHKYSNIININPTYERTSSITNDALLVMH